MNIGYGIISIIVMVFAYLLYTISGGEWFADNYKTQEVGKRIYR